MIDLQQARKRAKERTAAARAAGGTISLTSAQRAIARELRYPSWLALVRDAERFDPVEPDEVPWSRIRRASVICFVPDVEVAGGARVALYRHDGRWVTPGGKVESDEDVWNDTMLRIPLQAMGFRRQGTHPFAIDVDRRHVVFWVDGGRYTGTRPAARDVPWWEGAPADAVELLAGQGDGALARLVEAADEHRRTLSYARHAADLRRTLVGGYLAADNPRGGSGFGGSDADWRDARGQLVDALVGLPVTGRPLRLLDECCANGHLAVSLRQWAKERDRDIEVYGVDVAPELVARARHDHPDLADRFWVGDALTWTHPDGLRFDVVHMLYDVIPSDRWAELTAHLLAEVVDDGGRLLISHYGELPESLSPRAIAMRLGHAVAGETSAPTRNGHPRGFRSVWIDASTVRAG